MHEKSDIAELEDRIATSLQNNEWVCVSRDLRKLVELCEIHRHRYFLAKTREQFFSIPTARSFFRAGYGHQFNLRYDALGDYPKTQMLQYFVKRSSQSSSHTPREFPDFELVHSYVGDF